MVGMFDFRVRHIFLSLLSLLGRLLCFHVDGCLFVCVKGLEGWGSGEVVVGVVVIGDAVDDKSRFFFPTAVGAGLVRSID